MFCKSLAGAVSPAVANPKGPGAVAAPGMVCPGAKTPAVANPNWPGAVAWSSVLATF